MKFARKISQLPRRIVLGACAFVLTASAVFVPLAAVNATDNTVAIEGSVNVANVTAGDTQYQKNVNAMVDDVVKVQVWYHNREEPDSGLVANNLSVAMGLPTAAGTAQTIGATISSDNSNTVTDSANVNLSVGDASLQYIPGSAKWRHNKGADDGRTECQTGINPIPDNDPNGCYVTEGISDSIQTGTPVVLENLQPCFAHEATVTVLMRVVASSVKVNKYVSAHDGDSNVSNNNWVLDNNATAGAEMDYMIRFENTGNQQLNNVIVGDNLPDYMSYENGTTVLYNTNNPDGLAITNDNVTKGGIDVGSYAPGSVGYVVFSVKLDANDRFEKCGDYKLTNVGVVRPADINEVYNTASTTVNIPCGETPMCTVPGKENLPADSPDCKNPMCTVPGHENLPANSPDCHAMCTIPGMTNLPANSPQCAKCTIPGKVNLPVNSPDCVTTVTELPHTGADSGLMTFAGLGLITAGMGYALTSDRLRKLLIG